MNNIDLSGLWISHLKNLLLYVHQNYLILIEFILNKLPESAVDNVK